MGDKLLIRPERSYTSYAFANTSQQQRKEKREKKKKREKEKKRKRGQNRVTRIMPSLTHRSSREKRKREKRKREKKRMRGKNFNWIDIEVLMSWFTHHTSCYYPDLDFYLYLDHYLSASA